MIIICAKLDNQDESCTSTHHIHTHNVLMCFLDIANNSTFVYPGKCEGSLFVWPQQRESQSLQKSFLMSQGLWAPKLTNTTELWDFTGTLTAGMCVSVREPLFIFMNVFHSIQEWHLQWNMKELSEVWAGTQRSDQKLWVSVSYATDETCWEPLKHLMMTSTARTKGREGVRMLSFSSLIGSPGSTGRGFGESDWCSEPEVHF